MPSRAKRASDGTLALIVARASREPSGATRRIPAKPGLELRSWPNLVVLASTLSGSTAGQLKPPLLLLFALRHDVGGDVGKFLAGEVCVWHLPMGIQQPVRYAIR